MDREVDQRLREWFAFAKRIRRKEAQEHTEQKTEHSWTPQQQTVGRHGHEHLVGCLSHPKAARPRIGANTVPRETSREAESRSSKA
jgi:hypothetical protein